MTGERDELDGGYRSPEYWLAFVDACRPLWEACNEKERVLAAVGGDVDLAVALWCAVGSDYAAWLEREVPVIRHQKPRELLASEQGRERLRALLMQMP